MPALPQAQQINKGRILLLASLPIRLVKKAVCYSMRMFIFNRKQLFQQYGLTIISMMLNLVYYCSTAALPGLISTLVNVLCDAQYTLFMLSFQVLQLYNQQQVMLQLKHNY